MLVVEVQNDFQSEQFVCPDGPVEMGRIPDAPDASRCVINDPHVSKRQMRIDPLDELTIRLVNLSQTTPILMEDGSHIVMGEARDARLPVFLAVGKTRVAIKPSAPPLVMQDQTLPPDVGLRETAPLDLAGPAPSVPSVPDRERQRLQTVNVPKRKANVEKLSVLGDTPTPEKLASWFEAVIQVQRSAASSQEFYQQTAQAVVDLIGLDVGMVMLRRGQQWEVVGRSSTNRGEDMSFSRTTLKYVVEERRTFYHGFGDDSKVASRSLADAKAVVASPIFNDDTEEVVGVVYGSASLFGFGRAAEIRPLEAQIVQVLAAAVGVGIARMTREQEAARRRVQFEQFFSPVLVRELDRDPNMLEGRDREVTMMFTDIRKFSLISEQLGPRETCRLVRDVMGLITGLVVEHNGVVVDYYGDGMCAMWNAPAETPNHAAVACRAAVAMQLELPKLNPIWQPIIGSPVAIGIGVNTGVALVGNIGSERKFKYGAMGKAVNLSSRVEGATKHLGVRALISASTKMQLGDEFPTRRIGKIKVVGATAAVDLYELMPPDAGERWHHIREAYETALAHYEQGQFNECHLMLQPFANDEQGEPDAPSVKLANRSAHLRDNPPEHFEPYIELESK